MGEASLCPLWPSLLTASSVPSAFSDQDSGQGRRAPSHQDGGQGKAAPVRARRHPDRGALGLNADAY